jgi:hypothetical protein
MGIIVPEANLPMGVTVSNVYMSFAGEVIYTMAGSVSSIDGGTAKKYMVNTHYKVYKDATKNPGSNIKIQISAQVDDITNQDVYSILYAQLKSTYPDAQDVM